MSIQERIGEKIKATSDEIRAIKTKASKFEERKVWNKQTCSFDKVTVQVASIHPAHPDWPRYVQAKREVSLFLTAKAMLKFLPDNPEAIRKLTKADVKELVAKEKFRDHAKHPRTIVFGAFRLIKKMAKSGEPIASTEAKPSTFQKVVAMLTGRTS